MRKFISGHRDMVGERNRVSAEGTIGIAGNGYVTITGINQLGANITTTTVELEVEDAEQMVADLQAAIALAKSN